MKRNAKKQNSFFAERGASSGINATKLRNLYPTFAPERIKKEQEDWEFYPVFLRDNLEKLCKEEVSKKKEKDENDADRKLIKLFNNKYYYNKGYSDGTHDAIKILATALNYTEKELNQILSEHKKQIYLILYYFV